MATSSSQKKTIVSPFQQWVVHPVTALIFSISSTYFVLHYQLFDFVGAAYWMGGVVLIGYLLLSRRYDPAMSYIFFAASLFVGYKAITIPEFKISDVALEQVITNHLVYTGSQVKLYQQEHDKLPDNLDFVKSDPHLALQNVHVVLCSQNDCGKSIEGFDQSLLKNNDYVIIAATSDGTKNWYLDPNLKVFTKEKDSNTLVVVP